MKVLVVGMLGFLLLSCKSDKRYHDSGGDEPVAASRESVAFPYDVEQLRSEKDALFKDAEHSPLPEDEREQFTGLHYFPADSSFRVEARLEKAVLAEVITMETTTGQSIVQEVFGTLHFLLNGKSFSLRVYRDPDWQSDPGLNDYLFLPFTDLTNGEHTYGGGRYLDLHIPEGDSLVVDFNKAYHPYCAYNSKYSCPLVPGENHIDLKVIAGERL